MFCQQIYSVFTKNFQLSGKIICPQPFFPHADNKKTGFVVRARFVLIAN